MRQNIRSALIGILILLLTACGQVENVSTPEPMLTQSPAEAATEAGEEAVPGTFGKYLGLNYSQTPNGLSNDVSMLIQDAEEHGLFVMSDGEYRMLWLSKMTHRDADGNAYWEVKDILNLSDVEPGMELLLDGCSINGVPDHKVFVIGKDGTISMAWRVNTTLNTFEAIPAGGIECQTDKVVGF